MACRKIERIFEELDQLIEQEQNEFGVNDVIFKGDYEKVKEKYL